MTIKAPVFRRNAETLEQEAVLGEFEFEQLPSRGDQFNIPHANGRVGMYEVICIAHEPNLAGERLPPDKFRAFVHVKLLREFW
jgi:hypothetical protein